uniref:Putative lambda recombination protein n=1 Tax=viral metagenome TaxID=1070528 RepID=A0A6M3LLM3_9ZZZZ
MKKTARQRAVADADKWFSLYIRKRDGNRCVLCGATERIQCGHLISRGKANTRYDEDNANAQCATCNKKHEHYPELYTQWWIEQHGKHGQEAYDDLVAKAWTVKKWTVDELREIAVRYKWRYEN